MCRNWLPVLAAVIASLALALDVAAGENTADGKYKPAFEMTLPATSGTIVADYRRAYRSATAQMAVKRWEEFLRKYGDGESIEDITDLTLLRQASYELMRLYYQMGRSEEADILLRKAADYATYSIPEPAKAKQWCETNKFCE
jgi:hypothetical protein